jgi:regulator of sirC expression with transglutaminase-like and TPR domain
VLLELGRFAEALQDAEIAVREEPEDPESYRARGAACIKVEQFHKAVVDLTQYVRGVDKYSARGQLASRGYYGPVPKFCNTD